MFAQVTPQTTDPWQMLVIALVPIIIQLLRARWPEITAKWWPTLAPILGIGADLCLYYTGVTSTAHPVAGMILGLTGVGLRELVYKWNADRIEKKQEKETKDQAYEEN